MLVKEKELNKIVKDNFYLNNVLYIIAMIICKYITNQNAAYGGIKR